MFAGGTRAAAQGLAIALRLKLMDIQWLWQAANGIEEKMQRLYGYISGPEFRQKVESIVESFRDMQSALEKEKRDTEKRWLERGRQIETIVTNVVGIYGDLQARSESSLPRIRHIELTAGV